MSAPNQKITTHSILHFLLEVIHFLLEVHMFTLYSIAFHNGMETSFKKFKKSVQHSLNI